MSGAEPIQEFAAAQMQRLLGQLAKELRRNQAKAEAEPIHDLRVSIRRFGQSLRLFREFVPESETKLVRKLLKRMMDLTSEVRNRDIAADLITDSKNTKLKQQLRNDRKAHAGRFQEVVRSWNAEGLPAQWAGSLGIPR